jgi:putative colanic acid biosynthesis UDP-glucose lipid carrier transferase
MPSSRPRIYQAWSLRDLAYRVADAAAIAAGLVIALRWTHTQVGEPHVTAAAAAIVVHYLVAEANGMYRSWRTVSAEREILCTLATWVLTCPPLFGVGALAGYAAYFPVRLLLAWGIAGALVVTLTRMVLRTILRSFWARGYHVRRFAVVGVNQLGLELVRSIEASPELGLKFAGFYDDRPSSRLPPIPDGLGTRCGDLGSLLDATRQGRVDTVYLTFPMRAEARIRRILEQLSDTTASVYIVPDFFVFELLHSRWTNINGLPAVSVFESPFYGVDGLVKRGLDLVVSSVILALAALPMAAIALAVKLSSPGPVFFRQRRYGLDGRQIQVWKFRTMRVCEDGPAVKQAAKDDVRVTRVGAFLRRSSLDELPQLFNVLEGSMSLVGPRPHASTHNEAFRKLVRGYMLRHKVKPGITGLAQVNGCRGETETVQKMTQRVQYDHRYIRDWSLGMDIKILLQTVPAVLSRKNAY